MSMLLLRHLDQGSVDQANCLQGLTQVMTGCCQKPAFGPIGTHCLILSQSKRDVDLSLLSHIADSSGHKTFSACPEWRQSDPRCKLAAIGPQGIQIRNFRSHFPVTGILHVLHDMAEVAAAQSRWNQGLHRLTCQCFRRIAEYITHSLVCKADESL